MSLRERATYAVATVLAATVLAPGEMRAVQPVEDALTALAFVDPALQLAGTYVVASELDHALSPRAQAKLVELRGAPERAFLDRRSGRWGTLLVSYPLVPGSGAGNGLTWTGLDLSPPTGEAELRQVVADRLLELVAEHRALLDLDPAEIERPLRVTVHGGGELIQIQASRTIAGISVEQSYLTAVVNHGNLVLLGSRNWGTVGGLPPARTSAATAWRRAVDYLRSFVVTGRWAETAMVIVPTTTADDHVGRGYRYRRVWIARPVVAGSHGRWEARLDAVSGDLLSFVDTNRYDAARKVSGGVYPKSNDGQPPDGVEQPGWPMPFVEVDSELGPLVADASGHLPVEVSGTISTELDGPFARIVDSCGEIDESSDGDLDLGFGPGTDCDVPPGGSPGNTHSARTTFYEVNRTAEIARGQLPENAWLGDQLTANTNISIACSAFWDGTSINLAKGGFGCKASGEIAAIVDHEWGHGMDQNDATGFIGSPAEGIADVYAALRLNDSCIGRSFFPGGATCTGYGDPCLTCTGVRELDWQRRVSGQPHDIDWVLANCQTQFSTPCGKLDHCESALVSESIWDLYARTLRAAPYFLDEDTALEIATRLTYLGAGAVGSWYNCDGSGGDGCNADGGYLNFLAADDDNGDLSDGTPHMTAIFRAFDLHGIACSEPAVQDGGCEGSPTDPPVVTAVAGERRVELGWDPVAGADGYAVFRAEGVYGCDISKVRAGEPAGESFVDTEIRDDFAYFYTVAGVGPADTCLGPMSSCTAVAASGGPALTIAGECPESVTVTVSGATPSGIVILAGAAAGGSFPLPRPCEGVELDLDAPRLLASGTADETGVFSIEAATGMCTAKLQAVDVTRCDITPALRLP